MSRNRSRDPLGLNPHWHVDCRLETELPEDNIVGTRFLINVVFSAAAFGALLFAGWLGYVDLNLRRQIGDWEQRIRENRAEVQDIKRMQTEYAVEAGKVDQAWQIVRPQFYVTGLIADIGRTRPDTVVIDIIEWNEAGVTVRGTMKATSRQGTETLNQYVRTLTTDEKISPLFESIKLTDYTPPGAAGDTTKFEIVMKPKPPKS